MRPQVARARRIYSGMERFTTPKAAGWVRCLDCGTVYEQQSEQEQSVPCPTCGYIGWIALSPPDRRPEDRT